MGHGDGKHPVLIPANPKECFEFGKTALDLSEELQTFVCVLSDLDIGMNLWVTDEFEYPSEGVKRGKVLDEEALEKVESFQRYADVDGDGVPYRTLPGTHHEKAAFFTRGTGHKADSGYSEDNQTFEKLMDRLKKKEELSRKLLPQPILEKGDGSNTCGLIAYGSTHEAIFEAIELLKEKGFSCDYLRVRGLPFSDSVKDFVEKHEQIFVVEQNRDAQMKDFLISDYPSAATKIRSVLSYDGLPVRAYDIAEKVLAQN